MFSPVLNHNAQPDRIDRLMYPERSMQSRGHLVRQTFKGPGKKKRKKKGSNKECALSTLSFIPAQLKWFVAGLLPSVMSFCR